MPRPKRSRVAPTRPATTTTTVTTTTAAAATTSTAAAALREPSISSDIYDVSDREKERVRRVSAANKLAQDDGEKAKELRAARQRRDAALDRLASLTSTTTEEAAADNGEESPDIEYSRRDSTGTTATARQGRGRPRVTDASGLDLDDDIFGNLDDSLDVDDSALDDTTEAGTATASGYRSTDTSSFNVALFKRGRPRASSIATKDDAPIRPSSRGPNTPSISSTLNLGLFRRRQREPSILGTNRKPLNSRQASVDLENEANEENENEDDSLVDDFLPDAESTPLDKTKRLSKRLSKGAAQDKERESSPALPSSSRKRKSPDDDHQRGRNEKRRATGEDVVVAQQQEEVRRTIEVGIGSSSSPLSSLPRDRFSTPDRDDPDMAPPASIGSSEGSPIVWPSLDTLAHRTYTKRPAVRARPKTPEVEDDIASDISSPPSLTHSPDYGTRAGGEGGGRGRAAAVREKVVAEKQKKKKKIATTAELASLLPRRRHAQQKKKKKQRNDVYDVDGSEEEEESEEEEDEEQDELSYVADARANRRRKPSRQRPGSSKGKQPASANKDGSGKRGLRTYGSSAHSDKENEAVEGESIVVGGGGNGEAEEEEVSGEEEEADALEASFTAAEGYIKARYGDELKKARQKFKEVDKWELDFEEVTESSSPLGDQDAR
ncbi:hypothetical protein QBC46DRAFT_313632 [Diplogelasinospora grovesii]|uniref:Uncharacterized protein n=1 Tax=Diplogelasinospora grovesii TaxID=303347 RepID=A0AAN6N8T1_9PEZI|nr:hypothetical protein QBC46DRAFT_313632 [Diplogelasinospora grovesii]